MSDTEALLGTSKQASKLWLVLLKEQYEERWWSALQLILKRSKQPSMDFQSAYDAGLVWISFYDILCAEKNDQLKNSLLLPGIIGGIANEYSLKFGYLSAEFAEFSKRSPYENFIRIYKLFDPEYEVGKVEDSEVIEGCKFFVKKMFEFSYLGELLAGDWSKR